MKKLFVTLLLAITVVFAFSQAKKPTIMVVPSDNWCISNNFSMKFNNQGTEQVFPDYKKALQGSSDLLLVIGKINTLFADRGFPLKNLETVMKTIEQERAEDALTVSSTSGASLEESPLDVLKRTAKADIIIQLTWSVNTTGPKKSITFNLQGLDAYTGKQIAGAQGTGAPSFSAELPVLLEEAVLQHLDNFSTQLQAFFDDLFTNGREITLRVKVFSGTDINLENEYGDEELGSIIEKWLKNNCVNGRFNTSDATENMMYFEQVRIPLFDKNGKAVDARSFAQDLRKFLKADPYGITAKVMTQGLGKATVVLGEK